MAYNLIGRIRPTFRGTWSSYTAYDALDIVSNAEGSIVYSALKAVPAGTALTSTAYWAVVLDASAVYDAADRVTQVETSVNSQIAAINASLVKKIDDAYLTTDGELCLTANGVLVAGPFAVSGGGGSSGYYTPSVSAAGDLSWSASHGDMPAVATVNIKGPKGDKGETGATGDRGADGTSVTHYWSGTTLVVSSASGTTSANLKGDTGATGPAGPQGEKGDPGRAPVRGTDYWTETDQAAMLQDVLEAIGSPVLGSVDDDNNIVLSGELSEGTYTLMYENADGSRVTVGSLTIEESDGEDVPAYTNLITIAEAYDSTELYNGTGYKDGYYLSGSAPYEGVDADCVLTGYIPYTIPETGVPGTIYISGAEVQSVSHCRIYFFGASKTMTGSGVQGTVMSTYFTIETLSSGVTKLTPIASDDTSMLVADSKAYTSTVYFRTSLIGTGENLIITVDEPIE